MVNDKPNITLLRLVLSNPSKFYKQDWYYDEEFANTPLGIGNHRLESTLSYSAYPSAVVLAWMYLDKEILPPEYVWTSDFDSNGDKVYVGGLSFGRGFQIHRHLARPKVTGIGYVFGLGCSSQCPVHGQ